MKKYMWTLFAVVSVLLSLCSTPNYAATGWIGATGILATANSYPQQGLEAGIQDSLSLSEQIQLRASASIQGQRQPEINYALLDVSQSFFKTSTAGIRMGRVQLPYGFINDTRVHPSSRLGIIPSPSIVWPQNKALYDLGDGAVLYASTYLKEWVLEAEAGNITRTKPQPQKNYVPNLIGVESKQVETTFLHLAATYSRLVFRVDEMQPTQTFTISEKHFTDQVKILPKSRWVLGDRTVDYRLSYRGLKYWGDHYSVTAERAIFKYTGTGSLQEYYDAFGGAIGSLPDHQRMFTNLLYEYFVDSERRVFAGIGRSFSDRDSQNIGENMIGGKIRKDKILYKAQIIFSMTNRWTEFASNGSPKDVTTPFTLFAASMIYEF